MEDLKINRKLVHRRITGMPLSRFLPNILTVFSICAGFASIKFVMSGDLDMSAACILIAAVLDGTDGRVARLLKKESHFGAELDSLADFLNFGVAPGIISYVASLKSLGNIGWAISLFAVVCCALRLARFNTLKFYDDSCDENREKSAFEANFSVGVAAPAGALVVISPIVFALGTGFNFFIDETCFAVSTLIAGLLMISKIRTFVLKKVRVTPVIAPVVIILLSVIIICAFANLWATVSFLIIVYILSIPFSSRMYSKKIAEKECDHCVEE